MFAGIIKKVIQDDETNGYQDLISNCLALMVLMMTIYKLVTNFEVVLMITTHEVKKLLKLAQPVKYA